MSFGTEKRKIAIIGVGYVGASIAYALVVARIAREIVLIEQKSHLEKCLAEVNDIRHGIPFMGSSNIYSGTYADIKDCDLIIVTAGRNRRPNEIRLELAKDNVTVARSVTDEIQKHYNGGLILVVTNPVDIITRKITEWMQLRPGIVFGSGCTLDCSRLTNILVDFVALPAESINATVIGEHGEGQIVLWSRATVAGMQIDEYCISADIIFGDKEKREIEERVLKMGIEIIRGKGRTHFGISSCVSYIANAILNHHSTVVSATSVFQGEYDIYDVAMSLPSVISANGIERRLVDRLSDTEYDKLKETSEKLSKIYNSV
jgi:L-lactate dehydrogenase